MDSSSALVLGGGLPLGSVHGSPVVEGGSGVSGWAILSRYRTGKAASILFADSPERLEFLMGTLRPDLEHTVVPRSFVEPTVAATIEKAKDLPWVLGHQPHALKRG